MLYELQCCKFYLRPICIETVEMIIKLLKHNALHTSVKQTTVPTPSQDSLIKHSLPLHPPFLFQGWFGCLETNIRGRLKLRSLQWFNSIKVKERVWSWWQQLCWTLTQLRQPRQSCCTQIKMHTLIKSTNWKTTCVLQWIKYSPSQQRHFEMKIQIYNHAKHKSR